MKKAQMEIFGLIIVVMLIFMGMFFMLSTSSGKDSSAKEDYVAHQVAANVLNSLLTTKVVCTTDYNLTLTELLQNCANYNDITCDKTNFSEGIDRAVSSCELSEMVIKYVLNETLDLWRVNYFLNMTKDNSDFVNDYDEIKINFISNERVYWRGHYYDGCQRRFGGKSKMFPIPLYPGTLWIELFVCN